MIDFKKFFRALFENGFPKIPYIKSNECMMYGFFQNNTNVYHDKHFYLIEYDDEIYLSEKIKSIREAFNLNEHSRYEKLDSTNIFEIVDIENNSHKLCVLIRDPIDKILFLNKNFKSIFYNSREDDMYLVNEENEWFHILYDFNLLYKQKKPFFSKSFQSFMVQK